MATGSKAKKKAGSAKKRARAKPAKAKAAARGGSEDPSESLRASAKSFAAKLLR